MTRLVFIKSLGWVSLSPLAMKLSNLNNMIGGFPGTDVMPVLFIGHGSPMNAIEQNIFSKSWKSIARTLPEPKAILCISAHWLTRGTYVTAMNRPRTIYDFQGFPEALYQVTYDCPGAPDIAKQTIGLVNSATVMADHDWGLDHGTWSVLHQMYPKADIPVFQLSIDYKKPASYHYDLGKELAVLRNKGVLIIGSGNIVHNLRMADFSPNSTPYDWALEFDEKIKELLLKGDHRSVIAYEKLGASAQLSVPTPDHYYPLLYSIAMQKKNEQITFPVEGMAFRSGSMRSVIIS